MSEREEWRARVGVNARYFTAPCETRDEARASALALTYGEREPLWFERRVVVRSDWERTDD